MSAPCPHQSKHREALDDPLSVLLPPVSPGQDRSSVRSSTLGFILSRMYSSCSFSQCFGESWKGMTKKQEGGREEGREEGRRGCSNSVLLLTAPTPVSILHLLPFPCVPTNARAPTHTSLLLHANVSSVCPSALGTHGPGSSHSFPVLLAGTQQPQAPQPC